MPPISLAYVDVAIEKADLPISVYADFLEGGGDDLLMRNLHKLEDV